MYLSCMSESSVKKTGAWYTKGWQPLIYTILTVRYFKFFIFHIFHSFTFFPFFFLRFRQSRDALAHFTQIYMLTCRYISIYLYPNNDGSKILFKFTKQSTSMINWWHQSFNNSQYVYSSQSNMQLYIIFILWYSPYLSHVISIYITLCILYL